MTRKNRYRKRGGVKVIFMAPLRKKWDRRGWERVSPAGIDKKEVPQYWERNGKTAPIDEHLG